MRTEVTLLVLAAGMSSRYGGTAKQTDAMGPNGETILDYSIFDARAAGFDRVAFVIRADGEAEFRSRVVAHLPADFPADIVHQDLGDVPTGFELPASRTKPWGTAHAVHAARKIVPGPFCVINADDYYGRASFAQMAQFLRGVPAHGMPARFAMCGFQLRNTLSEHGTVSRGICTVDSGGLLTGVEELTDIHAGPDGTAEYRPPVGASRPLTGDETVSMNMWGFTPQVFGWLETGFAAFLAEKGGEAKSEFFIPLLVDALVRAGRVTVQVLRSDEKWFGVTYQEDKPRVQASIGLLVGAGIYPTPLWSA